MKRISCIIPAYNEEEDIGDVLSVIVPLIGIHFHEVIVVDDGSRDRTKEIVQKFPGVVFLQNEVNLGKSKTIAKGIRAAAGDYVFFIDADLRFLNEKNIADVLEPINKDLSDVSITFLKNSWPLFPFKKIDYLSGARALLRSHLMAEIEAMEKLQSYGLEVFINRIIIKRKLSITVVHWSNVESNFSHKKRGFLKGTRAMIKVWSDVSSTISLFEMYRQNIQMLRLLNKEKPAFKYNTNQ